MIDAEQLSRVLKGYTTAQLVEAVGKPELTRHQAELAFAELLYHYLARQHLVRARDEGILVGVERPDGQIGVGFTQSWPKMLGGGGDEE